MMFMNNREDIVLFVECEQGESETLRPSTLLGWVLDSDGEVYPVTPSSGVVKSGWAMYDMQIEASVGKTTKNSRITPKSISDWVQENVEQHHDRAGVIH